MALLNFGAGNFSDALAGLSQGLLSYGSGNLNGLLTVPGVVARNRQDRLQNTRQQQLLDMEQQKFGLEKTKLQQEQDQYAQHQAAMDALKKSHPEWAPYIDVFGGDAASPILKQAFPGEPDAPKTVGGMQFNPQTKAWEAIPGYTEQAAAIAAAGRAPQQAPQPDPLERRALAGGLKPGTKEYQDFMLAGGTPQGSAPFEGNGLDAQSYNIVLQGDPASPAYAAAYANLAQPKVTFDPVSQKMVVVQPDMSWARKPGQAAQGAPGSSQPLPRGGAPMQQGAMTAPTGTSTAQAGTSTMQVPGATITSSAGVPQFNDTQGKAAGFADRMASVDPIFEDAFDAGTSRIEQGLSAVPIVGNSLVSEKRQQFEQAERAFINAQLRRESGATISPTEFAEARKQYIPQPGDGPELRAQKRLARQMAIAAMQREGGPSYKPAPTDYYSTYGLKPKDQ